MGHFNVVYDRNESEIIEIPDKEIQRNYVAMGEISGYKRCPKAFYLRMIGAKKDQISSVSTGLHIDRMIRTPEHRMKVKSLLSHRMDVDSVESGYSFVFLEEHLIGAPDLIARSDGYRVPIEGKGSGVGWPKGFDYLQITGEMMITNCSHGIPYYPRKTQNNLFFVEFERNMDKQKEILRLRNEILRMKGTDDPIEKLPRYNLEPFCPGCYVATACRELFGGKDRE